MQLVIILIQTEVIWHIDDCKEFLDCQGFHIYFLDGENMLMVAKFI